MFCIRTLHWVVLFLSEQEVEKKIKELQVACEDLRKEITQRQAESKNLKEDLESKKREMLADKKTFDEANEEKERLKVNNHSTTPSPFPPTGWIEEWGGVLLAYWLRSKCLVCCQRIDLRCWMRALSWYPFHRWSVQVLCIVTAQGGGRWAVLDNTHGKDSGATAKGCCPATSMALKVLRCLLAYMIENM